MFHGCVPNVSVSTFKKITYVRGRVGGICVPCIRVRGSCRIYFPCLYSCFLASFDPTLVKWEMFLEYPRLEIGIMFGPQGIPKLYRGRTEVHVDLANYRQSDRT